MLALGHVFSTWFHLKNEMKRNEKDGRKKKIKAFKKIEMKLIDMEIWKN